MVFTFNATHALNIAVKTLVRPGDSVVVSGYEHNAVMRPLYGIGNVQIKTAPGILFDQQSIIADFARGPLRRRCARYSALMFPMCSDLCCQSVRSPRSAAAAAYR